MDCKTFNRAQWVGVCAFISNPSQYAQNVGHFNLSPLYTPLILPIMRHISLQRYCGHKVASEYYTFASTLLQSHSALPIAVRLARNKITTA